MAACLFGYIATGVLLTNFACTSTVHAREVGSESKASHLKEKDDGDITVRLQRIDRKFSQIRPLIRIIQQKIPFLVEKVRGLEDPGVKETIGKLSEEQVALQKKVEQLEGQIDELERARELKQQEMPPLSIEQLRRDLAEADKEKKSLDEELNRLNSGSCDKWEKFRDMRPVYVLIYKGRIVPIDEPYYSCRHGYVELNGKDIPAVEKKRVREGELVSQAINAGGCLHKLLSNLDPDKEYIKFKVCKDSIGAFHLAVEKVKQHKIPYSWKPDVDKTFIFRAPVKSDEDEPGTRGVKPQR